jgi:hypothetical protein
MHRKEGSTITKKHIIGLLEAADRLPFDGC